ncbi:IS110 family transposase [Ensifer adhaerens]|uniref:IS110 family transposase n=1 Tax=Ensifer adhaerens TaxID=106592 RepID=UPI00210188AF|nr:IS110 family transposase [Ensifer adhaerens]UTV38129.1 IS110 family transposase [Ensifer adhaerens]
MENVATIGLDIAKNVFQVYGADKDGAPLFNRKLRRTEVLGFFERLPQCLVGLEACGTAHYWARSIAEFGHDVRLIHTAYVKPFVKRGKTDAYDAQAIAEAVTRKTMRFVPIKSADQQAATMIFRTRTLFVRQRAQATNALRGQLAELGIIADTGLASFKSLAAAVRGVEGTGLPKAARDSLEEIVQQIERLSERVKILDIEIVARANRDEDMRRLMTIPGVGPQIAAAVKAIAPDPSGFESARHFAAWLGLTPKSHSSGGKVLLGHISKMGNSELRSLLYLAGATILGTVKDDSPMVRWSKRLRARRPFKVAAVAVANKLARIIWALLIKGGVYARIKTASNSAASEALGIA